ncbi:MAG: hypothetical protein WDA71_13985 [Actinomycetota bacterium]
MAVDSGRTDIAERFESHIGPVREGLLGLLNASQELEQTWGSLPAADSLAMAEIASEAEYKGGEPWGDEPVRQAHNFGSLLLVGAEDDARSACRLLSGEPTPVFAHVVLARAALEHAGRAWWLLDPRIGTRLRIARGFNDRLYGLGQQDFLPLEEPEKQRARERRMALFAEAERLGFRKITHRKQPPALEEQRPTATSLVRRLLGDHEDRRLGSAVYGLFSAVTHGTTFGVSQSVDIDAPGAPQTPGVTWGAVFTSSRDVCSALTAIILGLGTAYKSRNDLFGWRSEPWNTAHVRAARAAKIALGF